jgi:hypothetical protein
VLVTPDLEQAREALAKGGRVLWNPPAAQVRNDPSRPLVPGFSPIFWNTAWTNWQPPHTLGILCDPRHPALAGFATEMHGNWQWWELQQHAQPFILTQHAALKPIVQVIDDWVTNRKLGYVFEARAGEGRLLACSANLAGGPVGAQLRAALLAYMNSDRFAPTVAFTGADLEALAKPAPLAARLGAKASATSAESGFEAANALDGDPSTLWHTEYSNAKPEPPHAWQVTLREAAGVSAVRLTQRQDRNPNGQVAEAEIVVNGKAVATVKVPKDARNFRIPLPPGTKLEVLLVRVLKSHAGPFACLAEVDLEPSNNNEKQK